ncbi:MAG: FAD:protein FMN transferase [Chloroflexi bacterium]|nr:MAG: FAD:protein FMN transferase [Chloroflexota bacterium]TMF01759.1 MAG: FAD:protein FMN transferase [Chloroflexota bacterium]
MRPELHFRAMGTTCSLFGDGDLVDGERWVRSFAARITRFDQSSELSHLNAAAAWVDISPELEQLLRASLRAFEMSGGLVNVAVLPSMIAIGYTRPLAEGPTAARLDQAHSAPLLPNVLNVKRGKARLAPNVRIDLGGVAKGWMADRLCERLGANSLGNLGGDLFARGEWPVEIAGQTYLLRDLGVATSSTRRRRWGDMHHVIDPRTGLPAASGLEEVSVAADTATAAEVIAKTALIAGPDLAPAYCATHAQAWWLS